MGMKPAVKRQFFEGHSKERLAGWAEAGGVRDSASMSHTERAERLSRKTDHVVMAALGHLSHFSKRDLTAIARSMQIDLAGLKSSEDIEQAIRDCLHGRSPKRGPSPTPAITSQEILKEARRLSMPVVHLKASRGSTKSPTPVAIWNKSPQGKGNKRLWVMVDLRHHPEEELRAAGVLEVYDSTGERGSAVFKPGKLPAPKPGQIALYPVKAQDLPCGEIMMEKGADPLKAWGRTVKWQSADPRSEAVQPLIRYDEKWEAAHPSRKFHGGSIYAQLGGWPVTWPDASAREQLGQRLVLRTYKDSEPWLEVFRRRKGYDVHIRIT